jgi:hypothetical protein
MNLTFCAVYCGMIRQYSQSSIQFPHPTWTDDREFSCYLTLFISTKISHNVCTGLIDDYLSEPCDSESSL